MKLFGALTSCLTVLAVASCAGSDNNDNNNTTQFTLTLDAGSNGALAASPAGGAYDSGTVVTLTATPAAGFKVAAWTGTDADTSTSPTNHVTMSADKTVGVTFTAVTAQTFTLTIDQNANGTVAASPVGPTYTDGTSVALTATPAEGYTVDTWSGTDDDTSTDLTNHVTMTVNTTVSATFKLQPPQKTLTVTIDEDGSATTGAWGFKYSPPTPAATHTSASGLTFTKTFDEGTTVTLTGQPQSFWPFTGWTVDGAANNNCTINVTMDDDHAVTAHIPLGGSAHDASSVCPYP